MSSQRQYVFIGVSTQCELLSCYYSKTEYRIGASNTLPRSCLKLVKMLVRLVARIVTPPLDWLGRLLVVMPVSGQLEIRCSYRAPWRIAYNRSNAGEALSKVGRGAAVYIIAGE
ncbi:hypothetical protein SB861_40755 [Paraburkholderia sp. SIMBA_049]